MNYHLKKTQLTTDSRNRRPSLKSISVISGSERFEFQFEFLSWDNDLPTAAQTFTIIGWIIWCLDRLTQ